MLKHTGDVRLGGFSDRVSVDEATRWLDAQARTLPGRLIDVERAAAHSLAASVEAPAAFPTVDRIVEDGYALRAEDTLDAGSYNPLLLRLLSSERALVEGTATLVASGAALPPGADAVLSFDAAEAEGEMLRVFGEAAAGSGIERHGLQLAAGAVVFERGRRLRPQDIGVLASLGLSRVLVTPRPRVKLIVAGPKLVGETLVQDACGPMLRELVRRDGGIVSDVVTGATTSAAMIEAMSEHEADVVLVVGRTGTGMDDIAPIALSQSGRLSIHGVALRPGGTIGMGLLGTVPVILLPGDPLACFCAYELFAGRLIRITAGRGPDMPHLVRDVELTRKIVSTVGYVDFCQIRFDGERLDLVGSADSGGLASAVRADGFVIVPAPLEGYARGARVTVRVYAD